MLMSGANQIRLDALVHAMELERIQWTGELKEKLTKLADVDTAVFEDICLYVLHPHLWSLVEDLQSTRKRLAGAKTKKLQEQLRFYEASLVKSLVNALVFRQRGGGLDSRLMEVVMSLKL